MGLDEKFASKDSVVVDFIFGYCWDDEDQFPYRDIMLKEVLFL